MCCAPAGMLLARSERPPKIDLDAGKTYVSFVQVTRLRYLGRLGNRISVPLKTDADGYIGRECPAKDCLGYFKLTLGTGLPGGGLCRCPYCGHQGASDTFFTQDQIAYGKSVVTRQVEEALFKDLKSLEFNHRPRPGAFGIGLSLKVTRTGSQHPIRNYREKQLETHVVCDNCTLRYAIYGVFGWCPDCGTHNSFQILQKNLELAAKQLALAESVESELAEHLVADALKNIVSAFDGFGREVCARKGQDVHFQNLSGARKNVLDAFAFDFADGLTPDEWQSACRVFQKRHVLSHKMGVVDEDYVKKSGDAHAVVGRKIIVSRDDVTAAISIVEALGKRLFDGVLTP